MLRSREGFNFSYRPCVSYRRRRRHRIHGQTREANILLTRQVVHHSLSGPALPTTVITVVISQKSFGPINSKCFYSRYFVLVCAGSGPLPAAAPTGYRPFRIIALFIVPNQNADISIYANREFLDPFLRHR